MSRWFVEIIRGKLHVRYCDGLNILFYRNIPVHAYDITYRKDEIVGLIDLALCGEIGRELVFLTAQDILEFDRLYEK